MSPLIDLAFAIAFECAFQHMCRGQAYFFGTREQAMKLESCLNDMLTFLGRRHLIREAVVLHEHAVYLLEGEGE